MKLILVPFQRLFSKKLFGRTGRTLAIAFLGVAVAVSPMIAPVSAYGQSQVVIKLLDSSGNGMAGGTAMYYDGGWQTFPAKTDADGILLTEITKLKKYKFWMAYANDYIEKEQDISKDPVVVFQTTKVMVQLKDSAGNLIDTGVVNYYAGGWKEFGTTSGVQASMELLPKGYKFRMTFADDYIEKYQDVSKDPVVVFQTTGATVQLKDSAGDLIDTGVVTYYAGGWKEFGTTTGGQVSKELLPKSYKFRMTFAGDYIEKDQDVSKNPVVVFQTTKVMVQLKDSAGTLIDTGVVTYYAGGWKEFGTTTGGQVSKELLPKSYKFRMTYASDYIEKDQDVAKDPVVVFKTTNVMVQIKDSAGNAVDNGTVSYYAGGWKEFGTTSGGQVNKELLPKSYKFRMTFANDSIEKDQDVSKNPVVVFQQAAGSQAISVTVQLKDSAGNLIDTGVVTYLDRGWKEFGTTSGGQVSMELLPKSYKFRMTYANDSIEKTQDVSIDPVVVFRTTNVIAQIRDSKGNPVDNGTVKYYAGGWREFGITSGGQVTRELLPKSYKFRMTFANDSIEKDQDVSEDPVVVFQTSADTGGEQEPVPEWLADILGGLQTAIDGLMARVVALEGVFGGIQSAFTQLQGIVSALGDTVSGLQNTVNGLAGTITQLQGIVSALGDTVSGLQNTVNGLVGTINQLQGRVSPLESKVSGLEGTAAQQANTINVMQGKISQLESRIIALESGNGSPPPEEPVDESLAVQLPMNEGQGSVVNDKSKHGNNGNVSGATWGTTPTGISRLNFDGVDDKITVGDASTLRIGTGDFSMGCWFKLDTLGNFQVLMAKGSDSHAFYFFRVRNNNVLHLLTRNAAGNVSEVTGSGTISANTWYFAVAVRSGTTLTLYLNGAQDGAATGAAVRDVTTTRPLYLGVREAAPPAYTQYLDGNIGNTFLYNRALLPAEISNMYNTQRALFGI